MMRGGLAVRNRSGGFTLLEVLLAFVIFALSFALVLEILGGSMRSTVRARHYTEAALLAQSLMDMVGSEIPLIEGAMAGDSPGGYEWSMSISAFQPEAGQERLLELSELSGTLLFWVDLDVSWGSEPRARTVQFSTVKSILANYQQ
ncbi:MAG: type II secretion system protein [Xanthomonadales bacterium]|nr:type II secretion system protein [Xanthomonadales bacterium]